MAETSIQWTDATWNPTRGCTVCSPGCKHCYAMKIAARFSGKGLAYQGLAFKHPKAGGQWTGKVRLVEEQLDAPLRWSRPRRIFVNSMSDLFHEALPVEAIADVFAVMYLAPRHTFQVLTKRAHRMREILNARGSTGGSLPGKDPAVLGDHAQSTALPSGVAIPGTEGSPTEAGARLPAGAVGSLHAHEGAERSWADRESGADRAVGPSPTETRLSFGKHRGKTLDEVPTGYIRWLRDQLQDNLDEPERAHLRPKNVLLIEAIGATLKAKGHE